MSKAKMPTYEELHDALANCLDDLNAWAGSGPEGFSKDERKRAAGYQRVLDRAAAAKRAAWTPEQEIASDLAKIGSWQDANGRWCHKDYSDQWRGEEPAEYLQRLRDIKAGLSL